jgi:hypothetical protein
VPTTGGRSLVVARQSATCEWSACPAACELVQRTHHGFLGLPRGDEGRRISGDPIHGVTESTSGPIRPHDTLELRAWEIDIADVQKVKSLAQDVARQMRADEILWTHDCHDRLSLPRSLRRHHLR